MVQLKPINQQVVVIVGVSSDMGRETALAFAAQGAKVAVSDRNRAELNSLVEEITRSGGEAIAISADVADYGQVCAIAQAADEAFGRIDTWVHNTAAGIVAPFDEVSVEEFRRVIDVMLMGQVYGAKVAIPYLQRTGGGSFISISSTEGRQALSLQSAYSTAKHGLKGFIESLRIELEEAGANINLASIEPAVINQLAVNTPAVVNAILQAAEHPACDYSVGGVDDVGRLIDFAQRLSPEQLPSQPSQKLTKNS